MNNLFDDRAPQLFQELEQLTVHEAFHYCAGNQVRAAALLGVSRNVLRTLLRRHGLLDRTGEPGRLGSRHKGHTPHTDYRPTPVDLARIDARPAGCSQ